MRVSHWVRRLSQRKGVIIAVYAKSDTRRKSGKLAGPVLVVFQVGLTWAMGSLKQNIAPRWRFSAQMSPP
jgi:hypothetical protein